MPRAASATDDRRAAPSSLRAALTLAIGLSAILALAGCRSKPKDFENENDTLRRKVLELETQVSALQAERGELSAKLAELAHRHDLAADEGAFTAAVVDALPRCAGIEFARLTSLGDRDGTPGPEVIDVYIRPFDGRQRFVQVAGRLVVSATLIPPPGSAPNAAPRTLATTELGPRELREAYRSGPLGTHYTITLPLEPPNRPLAGDVVISATLIDAITGVAHEATTVVR